MEETTPVLDGQTVKHQVADREFTFKPMTFKKQKTALTMLEDGQKKMSQIGDTGGVTAAITAFVETFVPLLAFMAEVDVTKDWIDENCSYPQLRKMLDDGFSVSGLPRFFPPMGESLRTVRPAIPATAGG